MIWKRNIIFITTLISILNASPCYGMDESPTRKQPERRVSPEMTDEVNWDDFLARTSLKRPMSALSRTGSASFSLPARSSYEIIAEDIDPTLDRLNILNLSMACLTLPDAPQSYTLATPSSKRSPLNLRGRSPSSGSPTTPLIRQRGFSKDALNALIMQFKTKTNEVLQCMDPQITCEKYRWHIGDTGWHWGSAKDFLPDVYYQDIQSLQDADASLNRYAEHVRFKTPCEQCVIGSLKGNVHGLIRTLTRLIVMGKLKTDLTIKNPENFCLMFCGDYAGRERYSVETIALLLILKLKNWNNVFLCAGQNETSFNVLECGLLEELKTLYRGFDQQLFLSLVNNVFNMLPATVFVTNGEKTLQYCNACIDPLYEPKLFLKSLARYEHIGTEEQRAILFTGTCIQSNVQGYHDENELTQNTVSRYRKANTIAGIFCAGNDEHAIACFYNDPNDAPPSKNGPFNGPFFWADVFMKECENKSVTTKTARMPLSSCSNPVFTLSMSTTGKTPNALFSSDSFCYVVNTEESGTLVQCHQYINKNNTDDAFCTLRIHVPDRNRRLLPPNPDDFQTTRIIIAPPKPSNPIQAYRTEYVMDPVTVEWNKELNPEQLRQDLGQLISKVEDPLYHQCLTRKMSLAEQEFQERFSRTPSEFPHSELEVSRLESDVFRDFREENSVRLDGSAASSPSGSPSKFVQKFREAHASPEKIELLNQITSLKHAEKSFNKLVEIKEELETLYTSSPYPEVQRFKGYAETAFTTIKDILNGETFREAIAMNSKWLDNRQNNARLKKLETESIPLYQSIVEILKTKEDQAQQQKKPARAQSASSKRRPTPLYLAPPPPFKPLPTQKQPAKNVWE